MGKLQFAQETKESVDTIDIPVVNCDPPDRIFVPSLLLEEASKVPALNIRGIR